MKKRTRKQKELAAKRKLEKQPEVTPQNPVQTVSNQSTTIHHLRADLTKTLWLTILAVGIEILLWYFWR